MTEYEEYKTEEIERKLRSTNKIAVAQVRADRFFKKPSERNMYAKYCAKFQDSARRG